MMEKKKIRGELARLKASLAALKAQKAALSAPPSRDDVALRRLAEREKRLLEEIKTLESRLIPDIIA